jgi:hypothetical protein
MYGSALFLGPMVTHIKIHRRPVGRIVDSIKEIFNSKGIDDFFFYRHILSFPRSQIKREGMEGLADDVNIG